MSSCDYVMTLCQDLDALDEPPGMDIVGIILEKHSQTKYMGVSFSFGAVWGLTSPRCKYVTYEMD